MKRLFLLSLIAAIVLSLFACTANEIYEGSVVFYYVKNEKDTDGKTDVITPYYPQLNNTIDNYAEILGIYFNGPTNYSCQSPFPAGTTIEDINITRSKAQLVLSPQFATISGIDFTVACACLTKTVIELTGVNSVQIRVNGAQLDGKDYLTFHTNTFTFQDEFPVEQVS